MPLNEEADALHRTQVEANLREGNTSRYGIRRVLLCPAFAAALQGDVYRRDLPASAARVVRGAAAS